jgi:ornithine decarboxylase
LREWVRRYLVAELTGVTGALAAAVLAAYWQGQLPVVAYAASVGETVGYYTGFLITRYVREQIPGPPRRRVAVILAAAVVEFGPAEIADTLLIRPAAMFGGSLVAGHVVVGVLIGKVVADVVFYAFAITSYEVVVRRLLRRFQRPSPAGDTPPSASQTDGPPLQPCVARPAEPAAVDHRVAEGPGGPSLIMDLAVVTDRYRRFTEAFPGVAVHFAMKCNPDPPLLRHLAELGSRFEIASYTELTTLIDLGVRPAEVIFSNPVKPWWHVRDAHAYGVVRFGFDSDAEVAKLARYAPGAAVVVRLAVAPAASQVPSEGKFGVDADEACRLLLAAVEAGLQPWGIAFHVGSQMAEPQAWVAPIRDAAQIMRRLAASGIRMSGLDIGGGFPAHYGQPVPGIARYGECIGEALRFLPYQVDVVAEPGRGLVADAGRLETTVIGLADRGGQRWVHLDVGAFNGGMEALETRHRLVLPMTDSRNGPPAEWNVTGPSCDSQDTLRYRATLSADLRLGDHVYLHTAGAYTTAYASKFNGFEIPATCYRSTGSGSLPDDDEPPAAAPSPASPDICPGRSLTLAPEPEDEAAYRADPAGHLCRTAASVEGRVRVRRPEDRGRSNPVPGTCCRDGVA